MTIRLTTTIFIILTLIPVFALGQSAKIVKKKGHGEVYYVLESDKKIKHGEYKKFSRNDLIVTKGYYKNGVKDSIWEYYNNDGQLIQKYDYSKNDLLYYFLTEKEKSLKYRLIDGRDNPETSLTRPPIFLGGEDAKDYIFDKNVKYPLHAAEAGKSGTVYVIFTIDKNGKTSNFRVHKRIGYGLDEEAIRAVKLLSDNWLPGQLNGQAVDVIYTERIVFKTRNY